MKFENQGKPWSKEDEDWLIENYEDLGYKECMKHLKRNQSSILHKASRLGLKRRGKGRKPRKRIYDGYLYISEYNDRYAVHRQIVEEHIGRPLKEDEVIHHKDGNKLNNNIENLQVVSRSEHMRIHYPERDRCEKGRFL